MLFEVMERTGSRPERTLMIGDTTHDLQLAANAGVAALAVSYGAHARAALLELGAEAVLDSPRALIDWLAACGQLPRPLPAALREAAGESDGVPG